MEETQSIDDYDFSQVCLACVTHAALYPDHKIYTLARNLKYRYHYVYMPSLAVQSKL